MANSRFEYVKSYESEIKALPETYIVIRVDGRGFTKFCKAHDFQKPTDDAAINLINRAAQHVMAPRYFGSGTITCAYGHSDEMSFILAKNTTVFERRLDKIMSLVVSTFSAAYVFHWPEYFPDKKLIEPPTFDARWILYPSYTSIRDYISWRQADCHINNQYNYTFWCLVQNGNLTPQQAQAKLNGTFTADKNEILFTEFNINYNNLPDEHKKGSVIYRKKKKSAMTEIAHTDIIKDDFWNSRPWLLDTVVAGITEQTRRKMNKLKFKESQSQSGEIEKSVD